MAILNLNKRNSEVSVLVQVSAEDKDLTFPVHKLLAPFDELRDQHRWLFHSRFQFEQVRTRGGLLGLFGFIGILMGGIGWYKRARAK